jgi:N-acetyltransferase 10
MQQPVHHSSAPPPPHTHTHLPNTCTHTHSRPPLQDFEALTPNLLARTIETVEGGGIIVLLLSNLNSLTQLYNLTMDVHGRLRTDSHQDVVGEQQQNSTQPS